MNREKAIEVIKLAIRAEKAKIDSTSDDMATAAYDALVAAGLAVVPVNGVAMPPEPKDVIGEMRKKAYDMLPGVFKDDKARHG